MGLTLCVRPGDDGIIVTVNGEVDVCTEGPLQQALLRIMRERGARVLLDVSGVWFMDCAERFGQSLPEGSYGRRNRQAIATRDTRVAARLRAVEQAYRIAIERDAAIEPDYTVLRSPGHVADREMELE